MIVLLLHYTFKYKNCIVLWNISNIEENLKTRIKCHFMHLENIFIWNICWRYSNVSFHAVDINLSGSCFRLVNTFWEKWLEEGFEQKNSVYIINKFWHSIEKSIYKLFKSKDIILKFFDSYESFTFFWK